MNHLGTVELYTEKLVLRKFNIKDTKAMFNNWANDSDVTKYLSWDVHKNIKNTRNLLGIWEKDYENLQTYNWAIFYDNTIIGSIALVGIDNKLKEAEVGYCISKNYWGKGIVAEALKEVIKFCFDKVGFIKIKAKHHIDNPNSGKVMQKAGMEYIETKELPLVLRPDILITCECYEIRNKGV